MIKKYVRPVLNNEEINEIHTNLKGSETTFWLPHPVYDVVKLRHFEQVDEHGNFEPPDIFYDGVIFGLTSESSHNNEVKLGSCKLLGVLLPSSTCLTLALDVIYKIRDYK
jgi:hypothetical protein